MGGGGWGVAPKTDIAKPFTFAENAFPKTSCMLQALGNFTNFFDKLLYA